MRPDAARLDLANYPVTIEVETRFQDLDSLGHINNVACAALFETGRVKFNRDVGFALGRRADGNRWLIARLAINYIREGGFPASVSIGHGFGRVGKSSWDILSAAFQDGRCIATCDCTLVLTGPDGAIPIGGEQRAILARHAYRLA